MDKKMGSEQKGPDRKGIFEHEHKLSYRKLNPGCNILPVRHLSIIKVSVFTEQDLQEFAGSTMRMQCFQAWN